MKPWNANRVSASSSLSSSSSTTAPSRWAWLLARVRASTWASVAVRVGAVVVALVVLGWIGRTAAAGPSAQTTAGALDPDASTTGLPTFLTSAGPDGGSPLAATAAPALPLPPAETPAQGGASHGRATATEPVYLNQASIDELRRLPGVGPKRAEAILVLRQRLGRFQRVEDLLRVKGVGRGAVKKWRPLVRLDAPPAPSSADGGST